MFVLRYCRAHALSGYTVAVACAISGSSEKARKGSGDFSGNQKIEKYVKGIGLCSKSVVGLQRGNNILGLNNVLQMLEMMFCNQ